ncbi:MAG: SAM hydrolase/SAM-dependent halogenase family protein [Promethearchaeota archaeon]
MSDKFIGLLTDFSTKASYVSSMKGVILSIESDVNIIDLSHDIEPQNIIEAAVFLEDCCSYFPEGFIFVIVVDPGVGSKRRIITVLTKEKGQYFIAPDNGVLDLVIQKQGLDKAVVLENQRFWRERVSTTFHGRDIMAPVAAYIASGVDLMDLGQNINGQDLVSLEIPDAKFNPDNQWIDGIILHMDGFGNIITNIKSLQLHELNLKYNDEARIEIQGSKTLTLPLKKCYSDAEAGELLCLINSENRFEIAKNKGSAAADIQGIRGGINVRVRKA